MKFTREPLLVFLLIAAAIFAADQFELVADEDFVIEITSAQQQRIIDQWQAQMNRPPTEEEAIRLLEQWLREEVYYREALAMGLDNGDIIIRRRLVQKLTFLTEDLSDAGSLTETELRNFYDDNAAAYTDPVLLSFEHRYFSSDRRDDAQQDAELALTDETNPGDPFMLQKRYGERSIREIGDLFGRDFARSVDALPVDTIEQWQGPIQSAYGWHLVKLTGRQEPQLKPFESVATKIKHDFQQRQREEANKALYEKLKARYEIVYPQEAGV